MEMGEGEGKFCQEKGDGTRVRTSGVPGKAVLHPNVYRGLLLFIDLRMVFYICASLYNKWV